MGSTSNAHRSPTEHPFRVRRTMLLPAWRLSLLLMLHFEDHSPTRGKYPMEQTSNFLFILCLFTQMQHCWRHPPSPKDNDAICQQKLTHAHDRLTKGVIVSHQLTTAVSLLQFNSNLTPQLVTQHTNQQLLGNNCKHYRVGGQASTQTHRHSSMPRGHSIMQQIAIAIPSAQIALNTVLKYTSVMPKICFSFSLGETMEQLLPL